MSDLTNSRAVGADGENAAAQYLLLRGYEIITRNFNTKIGEIDLIACSPEGTFVFVEVKSVRTLAYGDPGWKVSPKKRATIARVAEIWFRHHEMIETPWRIDAITITPKKIEHYRNCL